MYEVKRKGSLYLEEYAVNPRTNEKKRISVKIKGTGAKAKKAAAQRLREKIEALGDPVGKVSEIFDAYILEMSLTRKPNTIQQAGLYRSAFLKIVGDIPIKDLSARLIHDAILRSEKPIETKNFFIVRWKGVFRWAYRNDYIEDVGIYEKLRPIPNTVRPPENIGEKFLEADELNALLKSPLLSERDRLFTAFLAMTGLRIGEAIGLNDKDVGDRYIVVNKTAQIGLGNEIGAPKTSTSNRSLYIRPELKNLIFEIRAYSVRQTLMLGLTPTEYFFTNEHGRRIDYDSYRYRLGLASESIGHRITPHALRHTFASLMFEAGMTYEEVQRMLGHENGTMTRKIYVHVTERAKARTERKLDGISLLRGEQNDEQTFRML